MPAVLRALRHRNFRLFFSGQLISLTGTWMQMVALSWLVYRLTGSAAMLGLVAFAGQAPGFFLAPFGGVLADRKSRRQILLATQLAAMSLALAMAGLTFFGRIEVWQIAAVAVLVGINNAFDLPARQAFIVDMVGKEDLLNAIALNSAAVNGARLVGPAVAGLLVAAVGEAWCFFLNGMSYSGVVAGLLLMKISAGYKSQRAGSALRSINEGFSYIWYAGPIRALILLLALVSLLGLPYTVLMPIFAAEVYGAGPGGLGILLGAAGTGALCAALTLVARRGMRGMGRWVALSSASFGVGLVLFAQTRVFWLAVALLVLVGFSMILQIAASNALIQAMVPDELRGRVMAVYAMVFMGVAPLGALLAGQLAAQVGAALTVTIGGVGCVLAALVFALRLPALRREAQHLSISLEMAERAHVTG